MTYEEFAADVDTMIANLTAIARFPAAFPFEGHDYLIPVCEAAAEISGADVTFCKMFNGEFREKACEMMFGRALEAVS